jgi:pilus assembly protein CpaB
VTRRRRALLLGGLALLLGGLAATDVAGREAAIDRRIGAPVDVVVARAPIARGTRIRPGALAVRRVPARFAPAGAIASPRMAVGLRAAVGVPAGADLTVGALRDGARAAAPGAPVRPGERIAEIVAAGSPQLVAPGARVDVLVTREARAGAPGATELALEDVEVLSAAPAAGAAGAPDGDAGTPRVALALRVTLRQAVYLAAAQAFARELRLLPRGAGDRARGKTGMSADALLEGA